MPRQTSIALTVSIALVAVTTLLLVAAAYEAYRIRRAGEWEDLRATVVAEADRTAIALSLPIWSFDRDQIDRVIESTLREADVYAVIVEVPGRIHAMIRDAAGKPVAFDGVLAPQRVAAEGLLRAERSVTFGGEPIGKVTVHVTPRLKQRELRRDLAKMVILIALLDAAIVAILEVVLWRTVLDPLRAVERYAEAVSSGARPSVGLPDTRFHGEVKRLRASIERMVSLLDTRYSELTRSERRLNALFNASSDAIFLNPIEEDGRPGPFTDVNDMAAQRLGWSRDELVGMPVSAIDTRLEEPSAWAGITALAGRDPRATLVFESEHRTRDGRIFPVEISSHRFTLGDKPFVVSVARDITHRKEAEDAIHALATRLQAVREEEKSRISRDLHDELGQLLTGIKMDLRWVEQKLAALPPSTPVSLLVDHVVEASTLVDQTVTTVQRIAADLRPSALDRLGLGAALRHEARRFRERTGLACEVFLDERLPRLRDDGATALYRIAQEALTNVARHAAASRVSVTLSVEHDLVTLRVEDDGRGIGAITPGPKALGLLGMRERAAIVGGELSFSRGAERGTVVEIRVPLRRVALAQGEGMT